MMACWGVSQPIHGERRLSDSRCRVIGKYMGVDDLLLYVLKQSNP